MKIDIDSIELRDGAHQPNKGFCIMELVAYVNGEPWTDAPECSPTMVSQFLRSWNDRCTDEVRQRLKVLVPHFAGCHTHPKWDDARLYMFLDLFMRKHTKRWLRVLGYEVPEVPVIVSKVSALIAVRALNGVLNTMPLNVVTERCYRDLGRSVYEDVGSSAFTVLSGYNIYIDAHAWEQTLLRLARFAAWKGCDLTAIRDELVTINLEYVKRMLQLGR